MAVIVVPVATAQVAVTEVGVEIAVGAGVV